MEEFSTSELFKIQRIVKENQFRLKELTGNYFDMQIEEGKQILDKMETMIDQSFPEADFNYKAKLKELDDKLGKSIEDSVNYK